MAVPKKRTSYSRKRKRRSHLALKEPSVVRCACGAYKRPHVVCATCGAYGKTRF